MVKITIQGLIWEFNSCSLHLKSDLSTIVNQDISWIVQVIHHSNLKNIFYLAIENWTPDQDELGPKKQLPAPNIKTFPGEFKVQNPEFVRTVLQIKVIFISCKCLSPDRNYQLVKGYLQTILV